MMKTELFFISIFSFISFFVSAQKQKETSANKNDTLATKQWHYKPNIVLGIDVLHLGLMSFSDQKLIQGHVMSTLNKKIHALVDIGYEKNIYDKNGYDVSANGLFVKLGSYYMFSPDPENSENGFYFGGKLAASFYQQELKAIPIRGFQGSDSYASFPKSSQSSYWAEAMLGGRVELLKSRIYLDAQVQPRYLIYSTKQDDITPMVIPGFGTDSNKFKIGFSWSVAYKFK